MSDSEPLDFDSLWQTSRRFPGGPDADLFEIRRIARFGSAMSETELLDAAHAAPAPVATRPPRVAAAVPAEMLDGDEIIQLSIKPSLWYVPLVSMGGVGAMVVIAAGVSMLASTFGWTPVLQLVFQMAVLGSVLRVAFASLQWASRLYVLTNRRVMVFQGVFNVSVSECKLANIADALLDIAWYERPLRLGSVRMPAKSDDLPTIHWTCVPRPAETQQLLAQAIRKSRR